MLLAIDEIANVTADSTVVIYGMVSDVHGLPDALTGRNPAEVFERFFGPPEFHVLAPAVQGDTPPPSFVKANTLFPIANPPAFALWPDDAPNLPAHRQALVQVPFAPPALRGPSAAWIFVIAPDGGMVMTAVQLLTYTDLGGPGEGVPISADRSLVGFSGAIPFPPNPGSQPPALKHALRMASWKLPAGGFDLDLWSKYALVPIPWFVSPQAWGVSVTQTILLATKSPARNVHWNDWSRPPEYKDIIPSPPILHVTLVVGPTIMIKRSWERDFQARLIEPPTTAQRAWAGICRQMMVAIGAVLSEIMPAPVGVAIDHAFDEYDKAVDEHGDQLWPPWLRV